MLFKWPVVFRVSRKSENCFVHSPASPNLSPAGCKIQCIGKEGKETATYVAAFYKDDWPEELVDNMKVAASILKRHDHPKTLDREKGRHLHISFDYYCCYTEEEAVKIGKFLKLILGHLARYGLII